MDFAKDDLRRFLDPIPPEDYKQWRELLKDAQKYRAGKDIDVEKDVLRILVRKLNIYINKKEKTEADRKVEEMFSNCKPQGLFASCNFLDIPEVRDEMKRKGTTIGDVLDDLRHGINPAPDKEPNLTEIFKNCKWTKDTWFAYIDQLFKTNSI